MHTPTPYEVTIAAKLEQLPVPDMMDSIWASIEMQLDGSLPADEGANTPSQNPVKGTPGMGMGLYFSILVAVIITIVLIYKANKKDRNKNINTPVPAKTEMITPVIVSDPNNTIPAQKNTVSPAVITKKDSTILPFIPGNRISFDSLIQQPFTIKKTDSSAVLQNKPALPAFDSIAPPPLIKPRGVKGISNDDYRIQEGKKDSLKKGG